MQSYRSRMFVAVGLVAGGSVASALYSITSGIAVCGLMASVRSSAAR